MPKATGQSVFRSRAGYIFLTLSALVLLVLSSFLVGSFLTASVSQTNSPTSVHNGLTGKSPPSTTAESILSSSNLNTQSGLSLATTSYANDWTTYHYDNNRTGYTGSIPAISSPAVSWKGKVDGAVYAEPLYYNGYVFIATENDTLYALNANTGAIAWSSHLGTPANSLVSPYACNGHGPDIKPTIGITGTPVIDPTSGTLYVAALISNDGYLLFAYNANTGQQLWYSTITAPNFSYLPQEQRGALALANGLVYVAFGGYSWNCFSPGPSGWVIAMSATGGGEQYAYNVPSRPEADVWTPEGVSVDSSGNVYMVTGDSNNATFDFGNSVIKLTSHLSFVDSNANYFAPPNWQYTNLNDLDLGSTGATILSDNLIFAIGKYNMGYLLSDSNLGGIGGQLYEAQVCGALNATSSYGAWGATSFANGVIYVPCASGLEALKLQAGTNPSFTTLWNYTGIFPGPPIIAGGAVWTMSIPGGTLYALNPNTGADLFHMSLGTDEHFTTPAAGNGLIFVAANETIYALNPASTTTTLQLTVNSKNSAGQTITGYHVILSQNGNTVATGFTPVTFALDSGQAYSVEAQSYGSCIFSHWSDGVTSDPRTFTATSGTTTFTAVYNCGSSSSTVTVDSVNQNGATITGYEAILYNSTGGVVSRGFTPTTFKVTVGDTYSLRAESYGSCTFAKWSDGVTSDPRTFTAPSSAATFTAVYNCAISSSTVSVTSADQAGNTITGYNVILYNSAGSVVAKGFTPVTFDDTVGQTYSIRAESYGSCVFSHWSDGVSSDPRTFTATSSAITFTAVYNCGSTVTVKSVNQDGGAMSGYHVILYDSGGSIVNEGFTPTTFNVNLGQSYDLLAQSYGSCQFSYWLSQTTTSGKLTFTSATGGQTFTAVYDCNNGGSGTITVYAHRVPASYWAPCFATVCAAGTGPGATMYFALYNSAGTLIATGFANENGHTFTGLTPGATYYVRAENCDSCHGSTHDVLFNHWGNGDTTDPLQVIAGTNLDSWYTCTNGCS